MTRTKTTIAAFDGAAVLAIAVGFGGVGVNPLGNATPAAPHPAIHFADLTGCVVGLKC